MRSATVTCTQVTRNRCPLLHKSMANISRVLLAAGLLTATQPSVSGSSPSCRQWRWICLALLFLTGGAAVQLSDPQASGSAPPTAEEPITPIPTPPTTDPLKLALGERLFEDHRLSRDGSRACSSCHDVRTNGADGNSGAVIAVRVVLHNRSSAAALGHLGAVHKRVSGAKTAR